MSYESELQRLRAVLDKIANGPLLTATAFRAMAHETLQPAVTFGPAPGYSIPSHNSNTAARGE